MAGLWLGSGVDEGSDLLVWVRAVGAGFAGFAVTRRSTFAGVASGEIVMLVGKWWLG